VAADGHASGGEDASRYAAKNRPNSRPLDDYRCPRPRSKLIAFVQEQQDPHALTFACGFQTQPLALPVGRALSIFDAEKRRAKAGGAEKEEQSQTEAGIT